jgi:uncharacterized protein YceK
MRRIVLAGLLAACGAALLAGCASLRTLADYQSGDPIFMSGTRFDVAVIRDDPIALKQFRSRPPAWPWIDLPFSFTADLFFWLLPRSLNLLPGAPAPGSAQP